MTGPAMVNILVPVPVTCPSGENSMAALTTALAKPVMGTRLPAPDRDASFWYHPRVVHRADRAIRVQLVRVAAVAGSAPAARYCRRTSSHRAQMAPPVQKAHRQSRPRGEGGPVCRTLRAYSS